MTEKTDSIQKAKGVVQVRTSLGVLACMKSEKFERDRYVKDDIVQRRLSAVYPSEFTGSAPRSYLPGTLAQTLGAGVAKKLSSRTEAVNSFLPDALKST